MLDLDVCISHPSGPQHPPLLQPVHFSWDSCLVLSEKPGRSQAGFGASPGDGDHRMSGTWVTGATSRRKTCLSPTPAQQIHQQPSRESQHSPSLHHPSLGTLPLPLAKTPGQAGSSHTSLHQGTGQVTPGCSPGAWRVCQPLLSVPQAALLCQTGKSTRNRVQTLR